MTTLICFVIIILENKIVETKNEIMALFLGLCTNLHYTKRFA